jgi:1-deoxy-D-xylulose-5-phosphate reductoisomerase
MQEGGSAPTVLNAANEVAVEAFLKEKIRFDDIIRIIHETMNQFSTQHDCSISEIIEIDNEAKAKAEEFVQNRKINI